MNTSVQIAAFKCRFNRRVTWIVKRTRAGHYFMNYYVNGQKALTTYIRASGSLLAKRIGITLNELRNKIIQSTKHVDRLVAIRRLGLAL